MTKKKKGFDIMRTTFTDTIEVKMTLDTDDMKSICDDIAADFPHESKEDFKWSE